MATGKHIGKVVVRVRDEEAAASKLVAAVPRTYFRPDRTYVLVGAYRPVYLVPQNLRMSLLMPHERFSGN